MRLPMAALVALATCWPACSETVAGVILASGTRQPLPKVLVRIEPVPGRAPVVKRDDRFVITMPDGRFEFHDVPPGSYQLIAARPGDFPQTYLLDGQYSTAVVVGAGLETTSIEFPYEMPGSITGAVTGQEGDGIAGATVNIFGEDRSSGRIRIMLVRNVAASAHGRFYVGSLPPGKYYLSVYAQVWYASDQATQVSPDDTTRQTDVIYPVTYYPGTPDFSAAEAITVTPGAEAKIQVVLRPVTSLRVRLPESAPYANAMLVPLGPANGVTQIGKQEPGSAVAPGKYRLSVINENQSGRLRSAGTVDIQSSGVLNAGKLVSIQVEGTVVLEGNQTPTNKVAIYLMNPDSVNAEPAPINDEGIFSFDRQSLEPGRYEIAIPNNPAFYLKSIVAKGATVKDGEIDLADGANVHLSLRMAPGSTVVHGTVMKGDKPMPGVTVLLMPARPGFAQFIRKDQSDFDGTFNLLAVAPGEYQAVAIEHGAGLLFRDPDVMKAYLTQAQRLVVGESDVKNVRLPVQPRQP